MAKVGLTGLPAIEDMCVATTGAGETLTVGYEALAAISWTGSDVSTNIGDASTDLSDPSHWHTLVSITGGPLQVQLEDYRVGCTVNLAEDAGEGIALKVTIDGTIIFQSYIASDGANSRLQYWYPPYNVDTTAGGTASLPIYCGTSFAIHAAYKGNGLTNAGTSITVPLIRYEFLKP